MYAERLTSSGNQLTALPPETSTTPATNDRSFLNVKPTFQPRDLEPFARVGQGVDEGQYMWWGSDLPPQEVWTVDPDSLKGETPTDKLGRVDVLSLYKRTRAGIDSEYEFDTTLKRVDHLYWSQKAYQRLAHQIGNILPVTFRNIPPNKIILPLEFERFKHGFLIPSDFPELDVMHKSIEAWTSAKNLYEQIHEAVFWERRRRNRTQGLLSGSAKAIPRSEAVDSAEDFYVDTLAARYRGVAQELTKQQTLPMEFQLISGHATSKDVLRQIGFMVRYGCRDGISGRQINFKPKASEELSQAA